MQNIQPTQNYRNYFRIGFTAILGSVSAASIIGLTTSSAFAQQTTTSPLTVKSTGTISGTLELPKFNPNYNRVLTIVDTDTTGTYYRNVGTNKNPQWVKVYQSDQVIQVRRDGSLNPYVRFKGIPVTSFDAVINSPALSDGEMTTFRYDGRPDMEGAVIKAVVQDEFGVKKAYYTGTLTDPETGTQYQGTFELSGQGPRYSDPNGGDSPNVFDYKSDQPGKPRAEPFKIKDNSPLVKLNITVPEGTSIVSPSTGGGTTPPPSTGGGTTPPPSTGGGTTPPPSTGGGTTPPPSTGGGTTPPPSTGSGTTPPPSVPPTTLAPPSAPITSIPSSSPSNSSPSSSPSSASSQSSPSSASFQSSPSSASSQSSPSSASFQSSPSDNSTSPALNKLFTESGLSISAPNTVSNVEFSGSSSPSINSTTTNSLSSNSQSQIFESESEKRGPRSRIIMR
ncbi:hypothetical protein Riv7116_1211 [Rivularia sp. PCC 7116]|uniref:hypothetical protein n=1 Tax=Rivularia sp. PCC 7116 TaxID=373994 RepID=UPI00029F2BB1|nr:hypothetical protein [Rivularia sp. PCC 7116]AFY53781.1 hypothetical protein Riv7116_1211 [Rivularia sp. PCC 7116]